MDPHTRWKPPPPPPSYDSVLDTDRTPSSPLLPQRSEQQPLLPQSGLDALREGRKPRYSRELRGVLYIIGIVLLGVLVAQNAGLLRCSLDDALPEEKAALRAQWQRELAQHQAHLVSWAREHDKHQRAHDRFVAEEARWRRAREAFRHEQQEWQVAWEQEARHRAELERKRLGLQWAEPWGDGYCARYGAREYHATLRGVPDGREWLELCESMPVTIHGQVLDRPDRCEHNVRILVASSLVHHEYLIVGTQDRGEVLGHWVISDELDCMPHWGDVDDLVSF